MNAKAEIHRRAERFSQEKVVKVDYYRIRRRFAWEVPVRHLGFPPSEPIKGISYYPWNTWLTWALEERLFALGWSAEWRNGKDHVTEIAHRDLEAMANFPVFFHRTDIMILDASHVGRILTTALTEWTWLGKELRDTVIRALKRYLEEATPLIAWAKEQSKLLDSKPEETRLLHNISAIGALTLAMVAESIHHDQAQPLRALCTKMLRVIMEKQKHGAEGICYDGYIVDFATSWLRMLPAKEAEELVQQMDFNSLYTRTRVMGLPDNPADMAQIGDVEPKEMPFHLSAQAKLETLLPVAGRAAWIRSIPVDWLLSETLAHLADIPEGQPVECERGVLDSGYAVALRNGDREPGLFPVISVHQSKWGHMHKDNGHVCVGSHNEWLIIDPGYQQYIPNSEREFTLGETAHNCPVVFGKAQSRVPAVRKYQTVADEDKLGLILDITHTYDEDVGVSSVKRHIWLTKSGIVVVADWIHSTQAGEVSYTWHGCEHGYWERRGAAFGVHGNHSSLYIHTPGMSLERAVISRLRGSRGQMSLQWSARSETPIWWVFSPVYLPENAIKSYNHQQRLQLVDVTGRAVQFDLIAD